jgi:hypothetical protein
LNDNLTARIETMKAIFKSLFLLIILISAAAFLNCSDAAPVAVGGASSPTEAYKQLYAAVKSKDTDAIRATMTKRTIDFAQSVSERNKTPIEKVFENGFTATTFAESLPEIRDERVKGDMGNVEVWNAKDNRWEDLPFILEDGGWKLAIGDIFANTFVSPGRGRAAKEAEAANIISNTMIEMQTNANGNFGSGPRPGDPANSALSNSSK